VGSGLRRAGSHALAAFASPPEEVKRFGLPGLSIERYPMQLPNASAAYVPLRKLTAYLLSDTHPVGKEKALFFQRIDFQKDQPEKLQEALLEVARMGKVSRTYPKNKRET
jgi:hypothetical protein